ncbi:MAG: single-stranded DNA-binding protein [Chitinispirillaceae bacterium]|nr:single-stranded DNA-binding protein [Chitinispirillaceae bacterium]
MLGVNKVILIGHLGRDPELRYTPGGQPAASFTLATSERWNDKNGQRQERTEWHNIVAWGKLAELANQYLKKGRPVYIEGRIATRSWDDRDGNKKYKTEIVANAIQFLGPGGGATGGGSADMTNRQEQPSPGAGAATEPVPADQGQVAEEELPF